MFNQQCMICRQKNHSNSLNQLILIRNFLQQNINLNTAKDECVTNISRAFMSSTKNHCRYGLSCPQLSQLTMQANNIAISIQNDIECFIENASHGKLNELLYLTQGYFPQAYILIQEYWSKCHND